MKMYRNTPRLKKRPGPTTARPNKGPNITLTFRNPPPGYGTRTPIRFTRITGPGGATSWRPAGAPVVQRMQKRGRVRR